MGLLVGVVSEGGQKGVPAFAGMTGEGCRFRVSGFGLHRDSRRFTEIHRGLGSRLGGNYCCGLWVASFGLALRLRSG